MPTMPETRCPGWRWPATGTTWHVHHSGGVSEYAARAVAAAVEHDEARWSRFRPQSDVSRISRAAGTAVEVHPETIDLLSACRRWAAVTGGVFQPLVCMALERWGYAMSMAERPPRAARSPQCDPVLGDIEIDHVNLTARIPSGTRLDLGGIAKGWMAVRTAALVRSLSDDQSILIDAGGDLTAVRGVHTIAVEPPHSQALAGRRPTTVWVNVLEGEGVATSGSGRRRWVNGDGRTAHHLIDPAVGRPGPECQVTVIAPDGVTADVSAKVLALRPQRVESFGHAAMVTVNGVCRTTPAWDRAVTP